ncbi:MAG: gliding motility-associated C-terminal domain-containing protein, partial [Bacteroidales bacterium]|nr:gliding motility-associated C-terminal domain-containing protein [Bacteroidales bacterium]
GTGVVGNNFDPSIAGAGNHIIQYHITNGACSDSDTETIHVDAEVIATITPVGPFCETDAAVVLNAVSPGGTWSGTGVVGNNFDPNIAGAGDHIIQYDITNGACSDFDTEIIHVDAIVDATITPAGPFCDADAAIILNAVSSGGIWSGTGITDPISGIFSPSIAGVGDFLITYNVTIGACSDSDQTTIHIDAYPDATITPVGPFCENDAIITLNAANPGGIWSGIGVVGNTFNPGITGQGNHIVNYQIVNGACIASEQIIIHVDTIPNVSITPIGPFCEDLDFAYLIATSPSGTWSGTGVTNPATGQFSPLFSGPGDFLISYEIINGMCSDNDSFTIHVDNAIDPTINPIGAICQTAEPITLTAANLGGTWAGQGIIDPINGILDPSMVEHGNNTMTYTIINGTCISTDLHIYQVDAAVDATILSNPGTICIDNPPFVLNSVQSGGIWSGQGVSNPSTGAYSPLSAGDGIHEIVYSLQNGTCTDSDTIYITVDPIPDATIIPVGPFCETDAVISLTANTTGGVWSGTGVVGNTFDPSIAGAGNHVISYFITVGACSNLDTETIHVDQIVDATINPIDPICENSEPITLTVISTGGIWSGTGVSGNQFHPTAVGQGTYNITYNVSNGVCNDTDNINIIVDGYTSVSIDPVESFCENDAPVNLSANIAGGNWSGQGITDLINGTFNPSVAGVGIFNIDYIFNNGACVSNSSMIITVNPNPVAIISNLSSIYCESEQFVTIVTSPPGGTLSGNGISGAIFNPSVAGPGNHIINYDITNVYGCSDNTQTDVIVIESPIVSVSLPDNEYCFDAPTESLSGTPPGGVFSGAGVLNAKFVPTEAGPGTHEITYTYIDENGCTGVATFMVEISEPLHLEMSGQNLICFGENTGQVNVLVSGGVPPYTYLWDDPLNSTTENLDNLSSGNYTVTITDAWGCDEINNINISSPSQLNVFISSSENASCFGDLNASIQAGVSGGTPPYYYIWDDASSSTTSYLHNIGAGDYNVTITDNNGCSGTIGSTISQPDEIIAEITSSTNVTCNGGNDGTATVSVIGGTPPYSYIWNNLSHTPISTAQHLTAGNYSVTITDANACTTSSSVSITEPTEITSSTHTTDVICTLNLGSASITVDGGVTPYSYLWSNGNNTNTSNNLSAGNYTVTVTDNNSCTHSQSVEIGISGSIHANIREVEGILCYNSNDGILQGYSNNGENPLSYFWSNAARTEFNNNLFPGHYELTIIDDWGCTGTNSYDLSNVSQISIIESIVSVGCAGDESGAISVQVSGGTPQYLINWSTGTSGASITGVSPGNYSLTVTDANSCTISETYFVGTANPIAINLLAKDISCYGYHDGSISINAMGGTPPFTYKWNFESNNFTGASISNLYPGLYNITISDAQGCKLDTLVELTQPEQIDYTFITINPSCIGNDDGYIEIAVIGGNPPYLFEWGEQTASIEYISGLMQGNYAFTITDNNGCFLETENIKLIDTDVDCLTIPNAFTPNGDGINDTWIIENIEMFPWALIQVFNRWGQLVFEGYGAGKPWNGTWNGKIVPTGSYIYTVDIFNGTKYCGIVTVVQ